MNSNATTITEIWIDKNDLSNTKRLETCVEKGSLGPDQVLLKVDSFGFSANNITYALLGDRMGYWGFFQADKGWGKLPVWGFATVVASRHSGVAVGEKVFGYLPMASHLLITAGKVSDSGFYDVDERRLSISPVYDNYLRCAADPGYQADQEAWQLNYRPLFMTSFVLDDFVGEQLNTRIQNILLTSASSKTAYGCAHLLSKHKQQRGGNYRVVGLTSQSNVSFTKGLGCYDEVLSYQEYANLDAKQGAWLLDFAGNKGLLLSLQQHLGKQLERMIFIGATDVQAQTDKPAGELDGEVFFAPAQVKKRTAQWGHHEFAMHYAKAWQSFSQLAQKQVEVAEYKGVEQIEQVYQQALAGKLNNSEINVLSF